MKMRVIDLYWTPRRPIKHDDENQSYHLDDQDQDQDPALEKQGIYCLYGSHPSYGLDVLLYIGKTEKSFRKDLSEHLKGSGEGKEPCGRFWYHQNLSYALSRLDGAPDEKWISGDMDICESILIAANKPVLNCKSIDYAVAVEKYLKKQKQSGVVDPEHYLVRNWGCPGSLQRESSSDYWCQLHEKI